jgi:hypothetical protein
LTRQSPVHAPALAADSTPAAEYDHDIFPTIRRERFDSDGSCYARHQGCHVHQCTIGITTKNVSYCDFEKARRVTWSHQANQGPQVIRGTHRS